MHVIQSKIINYSYGDKVQKEVKFVRWWVLYKDDNKKGKEYVLPFSQEQELIFIQFMNDHPANFPAGNRLIYDSSSILPPNLGYDDLETDVEKPCLLLIRRGTKTGLNTICRRMDIVLHDDEKNSQLPFDVAGEIIMEKK